MIRNDLLVWVDLEMTSLEDVMIDRITEIAIILTDKDLNIIAEGPDIVVKTDPTIYTHIDPMVLKMHETSGIKQASIKSTVTLEEAEQIALAFLKERITPHSAPLCGNSIHTDRHFLRVQMPEFEDYLFYRCIDVSSLKELARRWAPQLYAEAEKLKGHKAHRAKSDILQSIEELRFYRKYFLKA